MQPLSGPDTTNAPDSPSDPGSQNAGGGDQPLSTAQRTTLEKLIVKIMALSPVKSAEIWAALRHDLAVDNGSELLARHFQPAEQRLQSRLAQAQQNHGSRQLLQQLTELLPQGNNRVAVSDYIRQQFNCTVLSQLNDAQLQQVLDLLQSGSLAIPAPQQAIVTDRPLLPAEHQSLAPLVTRLSATTGEPPAKIRQAIFHLVGIKSNEPLPARHFQLLSQYLQVKTTLSQQSAPTLNGLLAALKQPADRQERQLLSDYCLSRFNRRANAALTQDQLNDAIGLLFSQRLEKAGTATLIRSEDIATPPPSPSWWQAIARKPLVPAIVALVIIIGALMLLF